MAIYNSSEVHLTQQETGFGNQTHSKRPSHVDKVQLSHYIINVMQK